MEASLASLRRRWPVIVKESPAIPVSGKHESNLFTRTGV